MIDRIMNVTIEHEMMSFIDAFSGYNQILIHPDDQEKLFYMTERGMYCYKIMLFELKNTSTTYQHLVNYMFKVKIGKTMDT